MKKTKLFKLQGVSAAILTTIKVYDSFAVVNFGVDKVKLAIKPKVEGEYALYNDFLTDVGDIRRDTLHLSSVIN